MLRGYFLQVGNKHAVQLLFHVFIHHSPDEMRKYGIETLQADILHYFGELIKKLARLYLLFVEF